MDVFYKGFDLISKTTVPDCNADSYYLLHRRTGLEVFCLQNADAENLFSFAFRTPAKNAKGAAHIIEHSVLCGSEKFPLKEPFSSLMKQSVQTFLNAMTDTDKTFYPASSLNKADYFNLMDVYADAVFFPLLTKETFLQEGHRLEIDQNGNASYQGVVYNEMKGVFSSFLGDATRLQIRRLFSDSCYAFESGGDPLEIPNLTYEEFLAFHKKWYTPANCLLFLCGNIDIKEQLDFIQTSFLDRLEKKYHAPEIHAHYPFVPQEIIEMETPQNVTKPVSVHEIASDADAKDSLVSLVWKIDGIDSLEKLLELDVIFSILYRETGTMRYTLEKSKLGDRFKASVHSFAKSASLALSMDEVKEKNADKVKDLIFGQLEKITQNPISKTDMDAIFLGMDFELREVKRDQGAPWALVLLDRALDGWTYGIEPSQTLCYREAFEKVKAHILSEPSYITNLLKTYTLENCQQAFVVISPDKRFLLERNQKEEALVSSLTKNCVQADVQKRTESLHQAQIRTETEEELSCLPYLSPKSLGKKALRYELEKTELKAGTSNVPLFISKEPTNGIAYVQVCFPIDNLDSSSYMILPPFMQCATECGWKGKPWNVCAEEVEACAGDLSTKLIVSHRTRTKNQPKALLENDVTVDREWVSFCVSFTQEKAQETMRLLTDIITGLSFTDAERIKQIITNEYNSRRSALLYSGSIYATLWAKHELSRSCAMRELFNGITELFMLQDLSLKPQKDFVSLGQQFTSLFDRIKSNGAILHITADPTTLSLMLPLLERFALEANLSAPLKAEKCSDAELFSLIKQKTLPFAKSGVKADFFKSLDYFSLPSQVGFLANTMPLGPLSTKEIASLEVLSSWLSVNELWTKIRMKGGAYGAHASFNYLDGMFTFTTYRDPQPAESLKTISAIVKENTELSLSQKELERIITGTWGDKMQPASPSSRGNIGFVGALTGITQEERDEILSYVLDTSLADLRGACALVSSAPTSEAAIIGDEKCALGQRIFSLPS